MRRMPMNPTEGESRYYIEDTLLLEFLIIRYTEMLQIKEPYIVPVWAGLGMVALYQNKELGNAFKTLISSDSYTDEEVLTTSVDLFLAELDRLERADTADYLETKVERRPLTPRTARKFLSWSWGEGRRMKKGQNFRFYAVWELICGLALTSDEYTKAFDERCRFSESPMEVKLEEGLQIVKAATFGRRLDSNSFLQDMLRTGTISTDKEESNES
jgi:hypothetical protein